jgi:DNA-binding transcriptional MerR regulator
VEEAMKWVDVEWMELIKSAKKIGLSIEEVREFLTTESGSQVVSE